MDDEFAAGCEKFAQQLELGRRGHVAADQMNHPTRRGEGFRQLGIGVELGGYPQIVQIAEDTPRSAKRVLGTLGIETRLLSIDNSNEARGGGRG